MKISQRNLILIIIMGIVISSTFILYYWGQSLNPINRVQNLVKEAQRQIEIIPIEYESEATPQQLPAEKIHKVPFISQAPFGDWADDRQQDGCEEASLLMAYGWATGQALTNTEALAEILAMSAYEDENYGFHNDSSAADTQRLMTDYLHYSNTELIYDFTIDDMRSQLASGNIIVIPANGIALHNPNFTNGGPERHALVITGYNDAKSHFITNDPGTRNGKDYIYSYTTLFEAIRDYPSGHKNPILTERKAMIVVKPQS
ncbi:hypothetical protein COV81_04785 [Candidatus Peregrinibacteria bacterium CG11_big_fil_rev_8_21_14_0_20_41_10]|nr:MAG: hypothetical protein COV81_04785 [Candidatus Peregrinibacteria bacterium CG11_big_fil_rev_8_21_14_0_20_41_10]PIZ73930.1 MAG: hypothetical protein COY06_04855 [Candidatus Peregrinibacteria bacterium CG_4_10_14_0_2_um_filter_41_8]PJC37894.1 MAG: hypothetical protein CO045_03045 [Candidatus Peregrinibacteria bacterium CG_4_9_14_0_2_um_filter_41_14]